MAEYFSRSTFKRLPVAVQALPERERAAFIMLRMRRDEPFIAKELGVSVAEAREIIHNVRDTLVKAGSIDLVQDPVFFQIDHPIRGDEPSGRPIQLSKDEMDPADRMELDRFYRILADSLENMPKDGRRLLGLWFNKEMKAKEILNFYKKLGVPITDSKPIHDTTEQDVFYALEKNIKNLLKIVRTHLDQEDMEGLTPATLKAILNETGV